MYRLTNWFRPVFKNELTLIGCANGLGGRHGGCEEAPFAIKSSKLLKDMRFPYIWENIVTEADEPDKRQLSAIPHIRLYSTELARCTHRAIDLKKELCVISGDHSAAIGTWSGVSSALTGRGRLGLIWVDAHLDAHTPQTSESGNLHGMPVAHLLGHGDIELRSIFEKIPKVHPENLVMFGIRSCEDEERKFLESQNVRIFYMKEIQERGVLPCLQEAVLIAKSGTAGFGMSIDLDGFDPVCAPAVGTPENNGINSREFLDAIEKVNLKKLIATEIAEFLPAKDSADKKSEKLVIELITTIYTNKWRQLENSN